MLRLNEYEKELLLDATKRWFNVGRKHPRTYKKCEKLYILPRRDTPEDYMERVKPKDEYKL